MTMSHELGHLLWDPDDQLKRVMVDNYADVAVDDRCASRDRVEARANAFAVAFLAPPAAMRRIASRHIDAMAAVREVMVTFGINAMAARHHLRNITGLSAFSNAIAELPAPDDTWSNLERPPEASFPIPAVPASRRGAFAACIGLAVLKGDISLDSAASYLTVPLSEVTTAAIERLAAWHGAG